MTESRKQQMNSKMGRLCREAFLTLAEKHNLKVMTTSDHYRIVGPDGYVSERPHGDDYHIDFEPGHGRAEDWERFFKDGVVLAWVHTALFKTGDNFKPTDDEDVSGTLEMLGIKHRLSPEPRSSKGPQCGAHL
jgi:hypothetical protein